VGDRPVLSLRARAITAYGINQLSPKRFKHFWREFWKILQFLRATMTECDRADEFRPPGSFASPRSIASARLADLVGPNAVAGHERLDGVGLEHDPEKACPALDARGGYRFSLATNAKRLRGGHAQTKR
jgi:hypothetical protein